jgi:hypothetical protein
MHGYEGSEFVVVMPKFANLANEKVIKVIGNIGEFCD